MQSIELGGKSWCLRQWARLRLHGHARLRTRSRLQKNFLEVHHRTMRHGQCFDLHGHLADLLQLHFAEMNESIRSPPVPTSCVRNFALEHLITDMHFKLRTRRFVTAAKDQTHMHPTNLFHRDSPRRIHLPLLPALQDDRILLRGKIGTVGTQAT